jgi:hypothetical protein
MRVKSYLYSFCKVKQASEQTLRLEKRKVMPFNQVCKRQEREREKKSFALSRLNESERERKKKPTCCLKIFVVVGMIFQKFIVSSIKEEIFFCF